MPRKGAGGHQSAKPRTTEWLTPPEILAALGVGTRDDVDPCAPKKQPYPTARRVFTKEDNGLLQPWRGPVWLNPPYTTGEIELWLRKMAEHNHGTAMIFARTETEAFQRYVLDAATALLFMEGRPHFHVGEPGLYGVPGKERLYKLGERAPHNSGAPVVYCAYGMADTDILAACSIKGRFIPLRIPRSVFGAAIARQPSWREALAEFFATRKGPVELDELYRHFASHPKATGRPNARAKIRQKLQSGPYQRVSPGIWAKQS